MRMCPIASGSSGNSIYVGSERTHILVDAGISKIRIEKGLHSAGVDGRDIDAILITHEHADHIQGLGVFARKYPIPIYGTAATLRQIQMCKSLGYISPELFHEISPDEEFMVGDISVEPMRISHDAADPVAYCFTNGSRHMAIATDMGEYTDYTVEHLKNMDAILIESNHDVRMLQAGSYPYQLKNRILSNKGHLSNESSGDLISKILNDSVDTILLGHLSKENNYEPLAMESVCQTIDNAPCRYNSRDFKIEVAKRDEPSLIINV